MPPHDWGEIRWCHCQDTRRNVTAMCRHEHMERARMCQNHAHDYYICAACAGLPPYENTDRATRHSCALTLRWE